MKTPNVAVTDGAKVRILAAAESLYSRRAIESVSFREIARMAGHGNTNAVQHHFGGLDNLIQSIFVWRVEQMEKPREEALREAQRQDQMLDIPLLLRMLCEPILDLKDSKGRHSYAAFMTQYHLHYRLRGLKHAADVHPERSRNLHFILEKLFERMGVSPRETDYRIVTAYLVVLTAIVRCDYESESAVDPGLVRERFEVALKMASAALVASI